MHTQMSQHGAAYSSQKTLDYVEELENTTPGVGGPTARRTSPNTTTAVHIGYSSQYRLSSVGSCAYSRYMYAYLHKLLGDPSLPQKEKF